MIAAALSPQAFGALELVVTTTSLLGLIMNCGLNNSAQRFYWDKDISSEQRSILVSSGLAALFGFGVLAMGVGLISIPAILPLVRRFDLPLTTVALVASLSLMVFNQWLQYILDVLRLQLAPWRFMAVSIIFRGGGAIAAVVVVAQLGWGIDGILSVQAITALCVLPLAFYFIRNDLTIRVDLTWLGELVRFGYPFIFMGLAYWVFGSMDRWMLASMSSVEEVGIYSVAFRFSSMVLFVSVAFGLAWSPLSIKIRADNPEGYRHAYASVLLILLYVMLVVGGSVALFSGELIYLLMPSEYEASALPLAILCFCVIFQATQQVTAIGISLEKKTFLFARLAWLAASINFFLNYYMIPVFGATGAACATLITHIFLTGSYLYFTQILHNLPISWKKFIVLLVAGVCLIFVSCFYSMSSLCVSVLMIKLFIIVMLVLCGLFILPFRSFQVER
jgi:O-antigen/teichoic acid export membrane protein